MQLEGAAYAVMIRVRSMRLIIRVAQPQFCAIATVNATPEYLMRPPLRPRRNRRHACSRRKRRPFTSVAKTDKGTGRNRNKLELCHSTRLNRRSAFGHPWPRQEQKGKEILQDRANSYWEEPNNQSINPKMNNVTGEHTRGASSPTTFEIREFIKFRSRIKILTIISSYLADLMALGEEHTCVLPD